MDRRSLLRAAVALGGAAMMPPLPSGPPDLEALAAQTIKLDAALLEQGTPAALTAVEQHAARLARRYVDYPDPKLAGVAAGAAERASLGLGYAAWPQQAEQWAWRGRALAEDAGDVGLHARCTQLLALALTNQGQAPVALAVLERTRRLPGMAGWPLVGLAGQTARSAAAATLPTRARRGLEDMHNAAAAAEGPPPAGWWPENTEALVFLELGEWTAAEARLLWLASRTSSDLLRAQFRCGLAEAAAGAGELDVACVIGVQAAEGLTGSPCHSELQRLDRMRRRMDPRAGGRHVRELDAALIAAVAG